MLPYTPVVSLSLAVGFMVQGNASNLTSGLLAVAASHTSGATMALYSCLGFSGGFLGTLVSALRSMTPAAHQVSAPGSSASAPAASRLEHEQQRSTAMRSRYFRSRSAGGVADESGSVEIAAAALGDRQ